MKNFIKKIDQNWIEHKTQALTGNESIRNQIENIFKSVSSADDDELLSFLDIASKVLLFGPPGVGKTAIALELAGKLKKKKDVESSIYEVNMAQLISEKMGQTAKNVAHLFDEINEKTKNYYVVLIMDEIEVFFLSRENKQEHPDMNRAVAELMNKLDQSITNKKLFVIGLTNYKENLDPAVLRRFSFHFQVDLPTKEDYISFFKSNDFPKSLIENDNENIDKICVLLSKHKVTFDALKSRLRHWYIQSVGNGSASENFFQYLEGYLHVEQS